MRNIDAEDPLRAAGSCLSWLRADCCVIRYTDANGWQITDLLYVSGADRSDGDPAYTPGPWEPLPENELRRIVWKILDCHYAPAGEKINPRAAMVTEIIDALAVAGYVKVGD